ncbi:MAG: NADH-quinone oxidoreductase subunit L, partial [Muribaculaceae bacterium]|nr:NADH-quinone oxidoreductase subunit L [Muribaculaceae bacterium]
HHAPHDQPWTMTLPLVILAAVSCVAGFIPFGNFVSWNGEPYDFMAHFDWSVAAVSLAVAVLAIALATVMYRKENQLPAKFKNAMPALWRWCHHRFYWDELYMFITHKIIFGLVCKPIAWFDRHIIDGSMDAMAAVTNKASEEIKPLQSGQIQFYVWIYLVGALLLGGITAICLL